MVKATIHRKPDNLLVDILTNIVDFQIVADAEGNYTNKVMIETSASEATSNEQYEIDLDEMIVTLGAEG